MSAASGGFAPQWQDPTHADSFWFRDAMHFPAPVTPLNATFFQPAFTRGASAAIARLSMPVTGLSIGVHHGYVYMNPVPFQGDDAATQARFAEMQRLTMELGATNLQDWYETFEPRVLAIADEAADFDFAGAPTSAIARHLAGLFDRTVEVWDIHMRVNIPTMNAVFGLEEMIQHTLGEAALAEGRGAEPLRAATAARRRDRAAQVRMQPPPFIGTPPPADQPIDPLAAKFFGLGIRPSEDPKVIVGHAASPGSVTGIARVIRSLDQAETLTPGDILVCQMTMPAWTPLFAQAGGVVADTGGALSHCAIVAREYGLPCVAGTMIGTRTIPDGARIHVDGSTGIVRVLE